jgi:hypothetical protein
VRGEQRTRAAHWERGGWNDGEIHGAEAYTTLFGFARTELGLQGVVVNWAAMLLEPACTPPR